MGARDNRGKKNIIKHETTIGSVTGQVHTGSGDIIVGSFSSGTISNKDEFLAALREFKAELEAARQRGLSEDITEDAITEIAAAEREANRDTPISERIIKRLGKVKELLLAGTGVASATSSAVAAAEKLIPLVQTAIQHVPKIFGE